MVGSSRVLAERELPHASLVEGLRFTAQIAIPNVVQGLFRRRRNAVTVATKTNVDGLAVGFLSGLRRQYGDGALWIRLAKDEALLLFGPDAIHRVLAGSPDPFASDPEPKKRGVAHFQPEGLTISRNGPWEARRRFTEAVLDTDKPVHRLAARFAAVSVEEAEALPTALDWDTWNRAVRRVTRRIVLGECAAGDEQLFELLGKLMDEANGLPKERSGDTYGRFTALVDGYVRQAEPGSLAGLFADAPLSAECNPAGQVTHWLFALGDTLAINALRALAELISHPAELEQVRRELDEADGLDPQALASLVRLEASLQEAMRLWPTTPMLSRALVSDVDWDGNTVPAGTQVLIVNTFNHRDRERHEFADRFEPQAWISGDAAGDWAFNHFSHGPQGCPGASLALLVGKAMLATLLRGRDVRLTDPQIDPGRPMPQMLDFFSLKFELPPR